MKRRFSKARPFIFELAKLTPQRVSVSDKQGYVVAEIYNATDELQVWSEHSSWSEVKQEIQRLWNNFYFDCSEYNDWELEQIPNGFTIGHIDYVVMTVEAFTHKGWTLK